MEHRIRPSETTIGMYIKAFGGSWFSHPFWRAKFIVRSADDLEQIRRCTIPFVIIDDALGVGLDEEVVASERIDRFGPVEAETKDVAPERPRRRKNLPRSSTAQSKTLQAKRVAAEAKKIVQEAFADLRLGKAVQSKKILRLVDDICTEVDHNQEAFFDVMRLKKKNEYTYMHSVAVCTLMVNFARYKDRSLAEIRDYGMAGLLHDLGKVKVPERILDKPGELTKEEFTKVKSHPEFGHALLTRNCEIPESALDVCLHHHEKMDGTGYPFGLAGDSISEVARLGAICDVYDALTSERAYKRAILPHLALGAMWSWEGHFDQALLFTFMRSIAVFPMGLLVKLRSNRLAVVLEPRRGDPSVRVRAFFDTRDRAWIDPEEVIVGDGFQTDSIIAPSDPDEWGFEDWDALADQLVAGTKIRRCQLSDLATAA